MKIVKSVFVNRSPQDAFRLFTEEIGQWWPLKEGFSFGAERCKDMFIEGRIGGRFYERFTDGTEYEVGRVTVFQPPQRVVFTWRGPEWEGASEVEVRFTAEGTGARLDLEHRGWEQIGPQAADNSKRYDGGWDFVLSRYLSAA